MKIDRPALSYGYFGLVAGAIVAVNIATFAYSAAHADQVLVAVYLMMSTLVLAFVEVRLERGRLTLSGIAIGAAAILLNPLNATIVGLSIGVKLLRRGGWHIAGNALTTGAATLGGATLASLLHSQGSLSVGARLLVILTVNVASWALVAASLSVRSGESISSIVRHNFTPSFYIAHGYFALASLLVSYLLDGSLTGYVLATIVCVLALALTDTIAGRRVRRVLESELSDADRHLFHSRAVEGVVHNLRNHVATAVGYLREIRQERLDPVDRDAVNMAAEAANDAVVVLRSLSQGATPKVSYASEPTDLNELVTRALSMARPRARAKEIQLAIREAPDDVRVKADPLLLREVITNLVNNAIDAAPMNGRVELRTGRRGNGWPFFSVVDNGPGVLDDNRHHLFEPHFTTKESGTGLGLFMSYGIVKEHQGQLLYEGNRRGAVFTVMLPPFVG
jgi:two-component system sporulation sensor kinase A